VGKIAANRGITNAAERRILRYAAIYLIIAHLLKNGVENCQLLIPVSIMALSPGCFRINC
jgi:hypothetical protein